MFILGIYTSPASKDVLLTSNITFCFSHTNLWPFLPAFASGLSAFASMKINLSSPCIFFINSLLLKELFNFSPSHIPSELLKCVCIYQIVVIFLFTWSLHVFLMFYVSIFPSWYLTALNTEDTCSSLNELLWIF